ncbi:MAG: HAD hydrolase-like protein [Acidobacteriota bacterium]
MRKAIFIEKDGALMENTDKREPALMRFLPFAVDALKMLQSANYLIIVTTRLPEVAHGILTDRDVERMRQYLEAMLMMFNIRTNGLYYCPHDPEGTVPAYAHSCECYASVPQLLLRAIADHQINMSAVWMISSASSDLQAAKRLGCRTILIRDEETELLNANTQQADFVAPDLYSAADYITSLQQSIEEDCYAQA